MSECNAFTVSSELLEVSLRILVLVVNVAYIGKRERTSQSQPIRTPTDHTSSE